MHETCGVAEDRTLTVKDVYNKFTAGLTSSLTHNRKKSFDVISVRTAYVCCTQYFCIVWTMLAVIKKL